MKNAKSKEVTPAAANPSPDSLRIPFKPGVPQVAQIAEAVLRPEVQAADTLRAFAGNDLTALACEMLEQTAKVHGNDMKRGESLLLSQATTLDVIFNTLARKAKSNIDHQYLAAGETYLRLALKAQAQSRATIEALAAIKNPPVVYAKQANFAAGHQQVNNGVADPQAGKTESSPNKLLEDLRHEQHTVDAGAPGTATATDSVVAPMGKVKRAKNPSRKSAKCA